MKSELDIQEIIAGCLRSQRVHQRALVDGYSGLLYVICNRYMGDVHTAQDALQESWSLIFRKLHTYDSSIGKFIPWASTLTIRHCLNLLAKKKWKVVELTPAMINESEQDFQKEMMSNLHVDQLLELVAELPVPYRTVFNMAAIDGYSHKEIADALNLTTINSRARLNRARKLLVDKINLLNNNEAWVNAI